MSKYQSICDLIERRIRFGDYAFGDLPAEKALASEIGVSRMTARRAVAQLVDKGLLVRKANGRLMVAGAVEKGEAKGQVGVLMPAFSSRQFGRWMYAMETVAEKMKVKVQKVHYLHWDDPSISDALDGLDGVVVVPSSEDLSKTAIQRFQSAGDKVVVVDEDWSRFGIRSLDLLPPSQVRVMLDHLYDLGHRAIACMNTQPHDAVMVQRLAEREAWHKAYNLPGRLIDEPVKPYEDPTPKAFEIMSNLLKVRKPDFTAVVCLTVGAAMGAIRALTDSGIRIGVDVSVAAANGEGISPYTVPRITSTQTQDFEPFVQMALETILNGPASWYGPLAARPLATSLFVGDSTGPAPSA